MLRKIDMPKRLTREQREDLRDLQKFYNSIAQYCFIIVIIMIFMAICAAINHPIIMGVTIVVATVFMLIGKYNESNAETLRAMLFIDWFNKHN